LNPSKYDFDPLYHKAESFRTNWKHISITPPSFMKFCPVVPEICSGQVHVTQKERKKERKKEEENNNNNKKKKKHSKNNKSPNIVWET
jgi:hypothetical protein